MTVERYANQIDIRINLFFVSIEIGVEWEY